MADSVVDQPTSVEKKSRARKVFGDVVSDDECESLSYSPSPWKAQAQAKAKELPDLSALLDDCLNSSQLSCSVKSTPNKENLPAKKPPSDSLHSSKNKVLMQKTRDAVAKARNAKPPLRSALRSHTTPRHQPNMKSTARNKVSWKQQTAEAKELSSQIQQERRIAIQMERQLSSHLGQTRARRAGMERQAKLDSINEESKFKSEVHRDHQKYLKEEKEHRRRESVAVREKLRRNKNVGKQRLAEIKSAEERAILDERHAMSEALRESESQSKQNRRKSYAFRAGDARRIRAIRAKQEATRLQHEHASFELKWKGEKDSEEYQRKLEQKRRESLAARNLAGYYHRERGKLEASESRARDHESMELKWAGEKDSEAYHRDLAATRRQSLAQRNDCARRQRQQEAIEQAKLKKEEHLSYELKWEGERDSKKYVEKLERLRRESLVGRGQQSMKHAKSMKELMSIVREQEQEYYVTKRAAEKDSDAYIQLLAAERRESLTLRGQTTLHHRAVERSDRQQTLQAVHQDEEMRAADHRAKIVYEKECAERDRESLRFRREMARRQRLEEAEQNAEVRTEEISSFALKTQDRKDVDKYVADCKQRRRLSLAFRAKERQRSARWERQQHLQRVDETSQHVHDQLIDRQYIQLAKERERKERVIERLRHAGCSVNVDL